MPVPGTRRVSGLRREELAQLAGLSTDYYTRVEQGRVQRVSDSIVEALGRALRLDEHEFAHFRNLAQPAPGAKRPAPRQQIRPGLRIMLESFAQSQVPAYVLGPYLDVLAWNDLAAALVADFDRLSPTERNMARLVFLDPAARDLYPDWEHTARTAVGNLRLAAGQFPHDPRLIALVGELSVHSPEFRGWWAGHDVRERTSGTKSFQHPQIGRIDLHFSSFRCTDAPEQVLVTYAAEASSPAETSLRLLASWVREAVPSQERGVGQRERAEEISGTGGDQR
ncbi:transcriptional regulator [Streptomyces xantholiticus]|nr:transcriptional regulator [Streptomyces xantholiticus]